MPLTPNMLGIAVSRALKGRALTDYICEQIWQPFRMEANGSWIVDKAGIERGGCCLSITLRDYARLGVFMDEGAQAGGYEAVGAYGQSVTIYPKEHLVIAVNSAGVDHHGIGLARWDLIAAIRAAAVEQKSTFAQP